MAGKRAVVFDMDGVLFLSGSFHDRAFRVVLGELGISRFDYAEVAGMRTEDALVKCLAGGPAMNPAEIARVGKKKSALAYDLLSKAPPVAENCSRVLEELSQAYKIGLASSSRPANVELFLRSSGTARFFGTVLNSESVAKAKPDPEIYLKAFESLGVEPRDGFVVEDAPSGVTAGKRAGARVIGIAGTATARKLMESGADAWVESLAELPAKLRDMDVQADL